MTTLVTGGSGHLGANLVRTLIERGEEVRALVHEDARALDGLELERVAGDLRDLDSLRRAVKGCTRLYHLAAFVSLRNADVEQIYQVNVLGTRNLLQAAREAGVERIVHCSSFGAVGRNPAGASDESWFINPFEPALEYERSKAFAEHEVLRQVVDGLDVVIVNPSGMVGPHDYRPSFVGQTILDFMHGKMKAYVAGAFDFVPIRDAVAGHLLAMERGKTGQRYLLTGRRTTIDEILDWLQQLTGVKRPSLRVPPAMMQRIAIGKDWVEARFFPDKLPRFNEHSIRLLQSGKHGDNSRARRELGLEPTSVEQAFADAVAWFGDHDRS